MTSCLHWNFGPEATERLCDAVTSYDPAWIEGPLPPENVDALARLDRNVDVHLSSRGRTFTAATGSATSSSETAGIDTTPAARGVPSCHPIVIPDRCRLYTHRVLQRAINCRFAASDS